MLVHRSERRQLEGVSNLFEARRIAVLVEEAHQVIQNFFLPLRQCHSVSPRVRNSPSNIWRIKSESQLAPANPEPQPTAAPRRWPRLAYNSKLGCAAAVN